MTDPVVAQKAPFGVKVDEGKSYWWCAASARNNRFATVAIRERVSNRRNIRQKSQARCISVVVRTPKTFRFAMAITLICEQADVVPFT